jgi:N-ethylmaleimide reductase
MTNTDATPHTDAPLFAPVRLGRHELRNRIVMAPMTRNRAGEGRVASDIAPLYYGQRASAGLIVTEATHAAPDGFGYVATPGIESAAQVASWRRVTDAVHARGGRIFVQLWHVGRIAHPAITGRVPVAPSAVAAEGTIITPVGPKPFPVPRALERSEIPSIVDGFAHGARQALAAGFDGVELHGANGYLLDQFLRDGSNRRTDAYGGPAANRARLLVEVVEAVTGVLGGDRVGVRLSPHAAFNSMSDSDPATTFRHAAAALRPFGLAYLHVIEANARGGNGARVPDPLTPVLGEAFGGPLLVNAGYDRASAEAVLRAGHAAAVSFGAPYVSNPDLVERLAEGVPLAPGDRSTFYGGDARGYVDYPDRHGRIPALAEAGAPAARAA